MQLTYDEIIDVLDLKYNLTKRIGYSLNPCIYEVVDSNNNLKFILPDNVEINVTIGDLRLKSNLKNNQTLIFSGRSFIIQFKVLLDHVHIFWTISMDSIN